MDSEARCQHPSKSFKASPEASNCVNQTITSSSMDKQLGNYNDLHLKIDTILKIQRGTQDELKNLKDESAELRQKFNDLTEDLASIAFDVKKCQDMKPLIESLKISLGYLHMLDGDFDRMYHKMRKMTKFSNHLRTIADDFDFSRSYNPAIRDEFVSFGEKLKSVKDTLPILMKEDIHNIKKHAEGEEQACREEIATGTEQEAIGESDAITINEPLTLEQNYKCRACGGVLPEKTLFEKDGVSVKCLDIRCGSLNIVGRLKEGQRWVVIDDMEACIYGVHRGTHFQQVDNDNDNTGCLDPCQVCGDNGFIIDAWRYLAFHC